jgi:hypothetical protein
VVSTTATSLLSYGTVESSAFSSDGKMTINAELLNKFEEKLGLKTKSSIQLDEDVLIIKSPIYWSKTTALISVYTLIIRCFFNIENFNDDNFEEILKKHKPFIMGDSMMIKNFIKYYDNSQLDYDKINYDNYNVNSAATIHNFGIDGCRGINLIDGAELTFGETANLNMNLGDINDVDGLWVNNISSVTPNGEIVITDTSLVTCNATLNMAEYNIEAVNNIILHEDGQKTINMNGGIITDVSNIEIQTNGNINFNNGTITKIKNITMKTDAGPPIIQMTGGGHIYECSHIIH